MPAVLVVIVAFNSGSDLQRAVDALGKQTFTDFEAVVWDNASTDGSARALVLPPRVRLHLSPDNLGFAAGNNRAAELSDSRWIACLNPDAFPEPDWLERLVEAGERTGAASVASLQLLDRDPTLLDGAGDHMSIGGVGWRGGYLKPRADYPLAECEVFSACAAAALYRRDAFEAVGGFDERYFAFFEDVDLGFRLRLAGGACVLAPQAVVRHVGSGSASKVSGFAEYHGLRNLVWTFAKDMPPALWPLAVPAHLISIAMLLWGGVRFNTLGPRWRGLVAGWSGAAPFLAENWRRRRRHPARIWPFLALNPWTLKTRKPIFLPISSP